MPQSISSSIVFILETPPQGRTGISMWKRWLATLLRTLCTWVALGLTASGSRPRSAREASGNSSTPSAGASSLHQESLALHSAWFCVNLNLAPALSPQGVYILVGRTTDMKRFVRDRCQGEPSTKKENQAGGCWQWQRGESSHWEEEVSGGGPLRGGA